MKCYCGSMQAFANCCQVVLHKANATTPEQLMRSRFSAYCCNDAHYLHQTWHPSQRSDNSVTDITAFANSVHFINLTVIPSDKQACAAHFAAPTTPTWHDEHVGYVEFIASFLAGDKLEQLHEISRFVHENGKWYYVDGHILPVTSRKIGRNDPCPCHSGRKFKQCSPHQQAG